MTSRRLIKSTESDHFHNWINLEDAKVDVPYKLNLNPPPDLLIAHEIKTVDAFISFMNVKLANFYCNIKYCVELSPQGRFHIHGWLTIKDLLGFYIHMLPRLNTMQGVLSTNITDMDTKSQYKTWDDYCTKQNKIIGKSWQLLVCNMMDAIDEIPKPIPQLKSVRVPKRKNEWKSQANLVDIITKESTDSPKGLTIELD